MTNNYIWYQTKEQDFSYKSGDRYLLLKTLIMYNNKFAKPKFNAATCDS